MLIVCHKSVTLIKYHVLVCVVCVCRHSAECPRAPCMGDFLRRKTSNATAERVKGVSQTTDVVACVTPMQRLCFTQFGASLRRAESKAMCMLRYRPALGSKRISVCLVEVLWTGGEGDKASFARFYSAIDSRIAESELAAFKVDSIV